MGSSRLRRGAPYLAGTAVCALSLSAAALIWWGRNPGQGTAWFEVARALLGFALVSGVGVLITLSINDRQARRTALENRVRLLTQFHAEVVATYNRVKEARRTLRALGWAEPRTQAVTEREYADFQTWMTRLCQAQLEFERLKRQASAQPGLFGKHSQVVVAVLADAENYLNRTAIDDWEKSHSQVQIGAKPGEGSLPGVRAFLDETSGGFKGHVSDRLDALEESLAALILEAGRN